MAALVSRLTGRSYRLVAALAQGGMGEVFVACEVGPKAPARPVPVAVKTLLPDVAGDRSMLGRFLDEATLSARLDHPNIARLLDFGEAAGRPFVAFELLDGADLGECLDALRSAHRQPPIEVALAVIAQACRGLHHAHTLTRDGVPMQVVHRDLSPSNLFVTRDGRAKVLDFGAATGRFRQTQTAMGMIIGKLEYMAPEQVRAQPVDARTDVYALGLCLYEALTLQRALAAPTQAERVRRISEGDVPDVAAVRPGVPPGVVAALERATAPAPTERFATAQEMGAALTRELAELTSSSPTEILSRFYLSCFPPEVTARRAQRLAELLAVPDAAAEAFAWTAPPLELPEEAQTLVTKAPAPVTQRDRPAGEPITDREDSPRPKTPVMERPEVPLSDFTPAPLPAPAVPAPTRVKHAPVQRSRRWMGLLLVAAVLLAAAVLGVALGHAGAALAP